MRITDKEFSYLTVGYFLHATIKSPLSYSPLPVPELVLKVRIQNPHGRENDFIEVELDRQELTYRSLLRVCCRELDISAEHVEKIRKLPNTMLRKVKELEYIHIYRCSSSTKQIEVHYYYYFPPYLCDSCLSEHSSVSYPYFYMGSLFLITHYLFVPMRRSPC